SCRLGLRPISGCRERRSAPALRRRFLHPLLRRHTTRGHMAAKTIVRPLWSRPSVAAWMLALACVVWGLILLRQRQASPARQHLEAGIAYDHQGRYDAAIREWQEAARLDPNLADAWRLLGYASISADRWLDAAEAFRQLRRLD